MPKRHSSILDLQIKDARWRKIPKLKSRLEQAMVESLLHLPKKLQIPCSMTVLLGTDAIIKRLNRDFRGIDKPTNVLSFPQFEGPKGLRSPSASTPLYVGDIVIAYQYMVSESRKDNKILINHLIHLMIHGILHLFGYDHILGAEAERMERLEKKIMKKLGLPNPYVVPARDSKQSRPG